MQWVMKDYLQSKDTKHIETHTGITANVLQNQKDTSTSSRQGQR